MKIIVFYLPQFHEIPENDEWWGKGFTEWVNVKKATALFEGHAQPRIPLNENYYNLLDDNVKIWQAKIAKEAGIYGFCYYHYWFNGRMVLEKPMEQMLANSKIDISFCICWANEPWTKAWVGKNEVILPQFYGGIQEWKDHFDYLKRFFRDKRYIKINGKPLMIIYRAEVITNLNDMLDYWNGLAILEGFGGLTFAYQDITFDMIIGKDDSRFDYNIEFQPSYAWRDMYSKSSLKSSKLWLRFRSYKRKLYALVEKRLGFDLERYLSNRKKKGRLIIMDYSEVWDAIINRNPDSKKNIPGAFVGWDNSPRKGNNGRIIINDTPELFKEYLKKQIIRAKHVYKKDMIFMYAWNEWAEGGYLEPDTRNEYANLKAIKEALKETEEFPID